MVAHEASLTHKSTHRQGQLLQRGPCLWLQNEFRQCPQEWTKHIFLSLQLPALHGVELAFTRFCGMLPLRWYMHLICYQNLNRSTNHLPYLFLTTTARHTANYSNTCNIDAGKCVWYVSALQGLTGKYDPPGGGHTHTKQVWARLAGQERLERGFAQLKLKFGLIHHTSAKSPIPN